MNTISYNPLEDNLILELRPLKKKPNMERGNFKFWWDEDGNLLGIEIDSFYEERNAFKRTARSVKLGNIWKGVTITEQDIKDAREELSRKIEAKF